MRETTFWAKVLGETFWAKVLGSFFLELHFESGAGCWAGWAGFGSGRAELWAGLGGLGWGSPETEIGVFDNNGQQQQAISIYFFLEGLGFRVLGF